MRTWVEKLGKAIQKEGRCTMYDEVTIPNFRIRFIRMDGDHGLFIQNTQSTGTDIIHGSEVTIKIYEDEFDYLNKIVVNLENTIQDKFIEIFNSFE